MGADIVTVVCPGSLSRDRKKTICFATLLLLLIALEDDSYKPLTFICTFQACRNEHYNI